MASGMRDSSGISDAITQDVGVLEVDGLGGDGVGRVQQHLPLSIELDRVGGFVHAVGLRYHRTIFGLLHFHSQVLLSHIFDVVHREPGTPSLQSHPRSPKQVC